MKKFLVLASVLFLSLSLSAQNVGVLNGPSGIPCAYLIENSQENLHFDFFANAQEELAKLIKGELDIGFLPPNVAAKVYTKNNGKLLCLGITGNGNLFVISKDESIKSIKDLNGKTIYCAGQGATPEYMTRFLLSENKSDSVLDFSIPNAQLAGAVISGKAEYAIVPEPFPTVASIKDKSVKRVLDLQKEFYSLQKTEYPITVLVVNSDYAAKNPKNVKSFEKQVEKAIAWTVKNPAQAGILVEKHKMGLAAAVVEKSIPNGSYVWVPAKKGHRQIEKLLSIFLENQPESIGGKLPAEGFYFN